MKTRPNNATSLKARSDRSFVLSYSRLLCVLCGAVLVGLLQICVKCFRDRPVRQIAVMENVVVGPWGRLELTPFRLEKPAEKLPDAAMKLQPTRWHFPGRTKEQTVAFLDSCALTATQRSMLFETNTLRSAVDGCVLTPCAALVLSLSPASRERIYGELEKSPLNILHQHPFRARVADAESWFTRVGLPEEKIRLAKKLTYRRGDVLCFCDTEVAKSYFSQAEFHALLRALYSSETLLVRLRVRTNDPIDQIAAYWGQGGREDSLKPLLRSAARARDGAKIDVDNLLPPLPRTWLYTYPTQPKHAPSAGDCFWTSLNFFRTVAENRFLEPQFRDREIRENYALISKADRLGDVIIFADANGITQHACVYVAGDIVFTKNGAQNTHPWVFMRLDNVKAIYTAAGGQIFIFRPQRT